jgi:DNA-binding XRE family transcriptional regulator
VDIGVKILNSVMPAPVEMVRDLALPARAQRRNTWDELLLHAMLGKVLQNARQQAGLSQEALAKLAGVDRSYISQLEHDHRSPTVNMLFRLCEAMKLSTAAVIGEVELARKGRRRLSRG